MTAVSSFICSVVSILCCLIVFQQTDATGIQFPFGPELPVSAEFNKQLTNQLLGPLKAKLAVQTSNVSPSTIREIRFLSYRVRQVATDSYHNLYLFSFQINGEHEYWHARVFDGGEGKPFEIQGLLGPMDFHHPLEDFDVEN